MLSFFVFLYVPRSIDTLIQFKKDMEIQTTDGQQWWWQPEWRSASCNPRNSRTQRRRTESQTAFLFAQQLPPLPFSAAVSQFHLHIRYVALALQTHQSRSSYEKGYIADTTGRGILTQAFLPRLPTKQVSYSIYIDSTDNSARSRKRNREACVASVC